MATLSDAGIIDLIARYKKSYIDNPAFLLSGYSQENQTVQDYENRQLLELMQNADDAKSDIVFIALDTQRQELTVSNNGEPFSLDGVESLMYTGLSTKNKIEYIGNKGLGFRSVLSWVNWVEVRTRAVSFRFSKDYSEGFYKKHLQNHWLIEERVEKEKAEKRLDETDIPIATLAFPELMTDLETEYTTSIILQFKQGQLKPIEEQLAVINEETLLFLPNIRKIVILRDGVVIKSLIKEVDTKHLITINNKTWNVYRKIDQVYGGNEKFNYTIVWQDEMMDTGYFYNYFPTDVETNLPCIIHATFDLNNSRKEINDTPANKHILDCIVESLAEIASTQLKKDFSDWDAYSFLTPTIEKRKSIFQIFYENIISKREEIECYPTVEGNYVAKEEAFYHGDAFSEWVLRNKLGAYFPNLLLPVRTLKVISTNMITYPATTLLSIAQSINYLITNDRERALLIKNLLDNSFGKLHNSFIILPLLIGENYNYEKGSFDEVVSALENTDKNYKTPDFIPITFIDSELKKELLDVFADEIIASRVISDTKKDTEDPSRTLKRIINSVVNLVANDISEVIRYIIQEMKGKYLEPVAIKSMVDSLWFIYQNNPERGNKIAVDVPLLDRNGEVKFASVLFFGNEYEDGTITEMLFKNIYSDSDYVLEAKSFNLIPNENLSFQKFFEWLGVNHFVSFSKDTWKYENLSDYYDFLFVEKKVLKPENARKSNISLTNFRSIKNIEKLKKIELYDLLILLEKSSVIKNAINQSLELNEKLEFKFGNNAAKEIKANYSFINFQVSTIVDFTEYTLSEDKEYHTLFKYLNLSDEHITTILTKNEIDSLKLTLKRLGVSENLEDLTEERITYLLNNQEKYFPDGKDSQTFYKKCLEYYLLKKGETNCQLLENNSFYGRKGVGEKALNLISKANLFYSDNILLPQNFLDNFDFINLPKRIGEDNVKDVFGVQLIKDELLKIELIDPKEEEALTQSITNYINKLKPYFLCYRLDQVKKSRKSEANLIKALQLKIMSHLKYKYEGKIVEFNDNEFIPHQDFYYLKIREKFDLAKLIEDPNFCDVIAEIVCMTFKVTNLKNTFRRIFKDGIKESNHILMSDDKSGLLEEAKKLLGLSDDEKYFWTQILKRDLSEIDEEDVLKKGIEKELEVSLPEDYSRVDFSNLRNSTGIAFLIWLKSIKEFDLSTILKTTDLNKYHQGNIEDVIRDVQEDFNKLLWKQANDSHDLKHKKEFFERLTKFDPPIDLEIFKDFFIRNKYNLEPNYSEVVRQYALDHFSIDLNKIPEPNLLIEPKYKTLFKSYMFGDNVDDMMNIIKAENLEIFSCLYFEGFDKEIEEALVAQQNERVNNIESGVDGESNVEVSNLTITESNMSYKAPSANGRSGKNGGSHNSKNDRKKAEAGKKEEDKVVMALKASGYEVRHVSKSTDSKHYDIEYKKQGESWRFLEVKKDSGGYFFMSKYEKDTAISNDYREKYDIAIVNGDLIHLIKSPFNFQGEDNFSKNSKFHAESTEFKVSFKVK